MNNYFIFDINKCVGCQACSVACMIENGFQEPLRWRTIHTQNKSHFPDVPLFHYSLACNHCEEAPCMKNCPAFAYSRDEITGAIIHHPDKCIGCKYCTWACPFDAPKFNPNKGIVEKCTFCNHRIAEENKPACANLCPTGALDFSSLSLSASESEHSSPVPVFIGSKIKTIQARRSKGPEMEKRNSITSSIAAQIKPDYRKIDALKEWPLLIFTLLVPVVIAFKSSVNSFDAYNYLWLIFMALGAGLSTAHLGKKERAWRALLNLKNSWLSREIASFALLGLLLTLDTFIVDVPTGLFAVVGFFLLLSIDMIYLLATWQWPVKLHSAQTIFIALSLVALIHHCLLCFVLLIIFRLIIGILHLKKSNMLLQIIRWFMLLITVAGMVMQFPFIVLMVVFLIGEVFDRVHFYNRLNVPSPQNDLNFSANQT